MPYLTKRKVNWLKCIHIYCNRIVTYIYIKIIFYFNNCQIKVVDNLRIGRILIFTILIFDCITVKIFTHVSTTYELMKNFSCFKVHIKKMGSPQTFVSAIHSTLRVFHKQFISAVYRFFFFNISTYIMICNNVFIYNLF